MTEYDIDLINWNSPRLLPFKPIHFVMATTAVTKESQLWIYSKLKGRFCLVSNISQNDWEIILTPGFEDPQEAVLYELTWS